MTTLLPLLLLAGSGQADPSFDSYRAHIAAADAALGRSDLKQARAWLASAPDRFRGWEWDYLAAESDHSVASFRASELSVTKVQTSPDGSLVATASADGAIRLWDAETMAARGELKGHGAAVFGLAFSADGSKLVTTGRDNSIRLWDVATRSEIGKLGEHPVTPYNAAFTPDGKRVVSVGWRMHPEKRQPVGLIRVWDVATRTMLNDQDYTTHPISCLTFSPDGKTCFIGTWEYQVAVFDMESYRVLREIVPKESPAYKAVDWVELDPKGGRLVTACKDKTAKFFGLESGAQSGEMAHRGHVTSARFTGDGEWLVTSSQDNAIRVWRASDGTEVARLLGHDAPVNCVAVTPSGRRAFSGDTSGMVRVWDIAKPTGYAPTFSLPGGWSAVFSPDGTRLASGSNSNQIEIRDAKTLATVSTLTGFGALVVDVAWSPDGAAIVGGSNDGTFRAFDVTTGKERWTFKGKGQMRAADWSRDGRFVASGDGSTGIGYVWDAATGKVLVERPMAAGTVCVAFLPDSRRVAFASDKEIVVLELPSGRLARAITGAKTAVCDIAIRPDGQSLAVGELAGEVESFRLRDGKKEWSFKADGSQWGVCYSPDGTRVASTGYDFATHLFDARTGREVFAIRDLPIQGFDVRFSPDGHRLAYMGGSGQVWIADRRPWRERG